MILTMIGVKLLKQVSVRKPDVVSFLIFVAPLAVIDVMIFVTAVKLFVNFLSL